VLWVLVAPQLLGVLLKRAQVQTLLGDVPGGVGLQVKHVLRVPSQRSHANMEVWALRVGHGLKTLLPYKILLVMNWKERDWHHDGVGKAALTQGGKTCVVCSTVSSSSTPMTVAFHGSVGLRCITVLTSHLSWPWAIDM
jgi:hypothetical protein